MKFSGKVDNGPMNSWLNFGGDPDHHLDTGIVFRIRYYYETGKAGLHCNYDVIMSLARIARLHCMQPRCTQRRAVRSMHERYGATLQHWACTSRHRHSNYDVITSLALGRGMHCPSVSSLLMFLGSVH